MFYHIDQSIEDLHSSLSTDRPCRVSPCRLSISRKASSSSDRPCIVSKLSPERRVVHSSLILNPSALAELSFSCCTRDTAKVMTKSSQRLGRELTSSPSLPTCCQHHVDQDILPSRRSYPWVSLPAPIDRCRFGMSSPLSAPRADDSPPLSPHSPRSLRCPCCRHRPCCIIM